MPPSPCWVSSSFKTYCILFSPWKTCRPSNVCADPQGFAYVEFLEVDAVQSATLLDGSELRGREIKVCEDIL